MSAAGRSSSRCSPELKALAESLSIPVTIDPDGAGRLSRHPSPVAGDAGHARHLLGQHGRGQCDLLIAVGARFDDRVTGKVDRFAPEAASSTLTSIPLRSEKVLSVDIPIVGDCKDALTKL